MPLGVSRKSKTRKWSFMGKPKEPEPEDDGRVNVRAYNKKVRAPPRPSLPWVWGSPITTFFFCRRAR